MSSSDSRTSASSVISSISLLSDRIEKQRIDINKFIPTNQKLNFRGSKVKRFKPIATQGLYVKMIEKSDELQYIVQRLVQAITNDLNNIHQLLQLIPDLLLVDYKIEKYTSQDYEMQIGTLFEIAARKHKDVQEGDNIFTYESKEGKNLSLMIDQFLWYLCKQLTANTQILATFEKTMRIFLSFLRHVSKSEVDALRLTAYIFAFRINKYFCVRKVQLAIQESLVDLDRAAIIYDAINNIVSTYELDSIYGGRQHNFLFHSYNLEFALYYHIYIVTDDANQFANEKNITFLSDLLELKKVTMIKNLIESCTILLHQTHLTHIFQMESFHKIVENLYCRLNHTNNDIAMLSAIFFATAFQYRHQLRITEKLLVRLIIRSYSINLKLARKCAQALAMYLKEFDDTIVYKLLIKMVSKFDKDTYEQASKVKYSYLVESVYHYLVLLQPYHIVAKLKHPKLFTDEEYKGMIELWYNSCCMFYNGKIGVDRTRTKMQVADDDDKNNTTFFILSNTPKLLASTNDSDAMIWIFKSLALIEYNTPEVYQLKNALNGIVLESIKHLDNVKINECLSMNIALFIQKASYVNGGDSYLTMLEVELAKTIKQYKEDLSQLYNCNGVEDSLVEFKLRIVRAAIKIRAIFTCNISCNTLDIELFYNYWIDSDLPDEIITEQIKICTLYFMRQFRALIQNEDNNREIDHHTLERLKIEARSYWVSMDKLLESNMNFYSTVLEAMGILIGNYKLLFTPEILHNNPILLQASWNYTEYWSTVESIFDTFLEECVLKSNDVAIPINTRRRYFNIIFTLYYHPEQPNQFTPFITKLVVYYEHCHELFQSSYKHFFNEVIAYDIADYFHLIVSALKFIDEDTNVIINTEKLCKLLAAFLLNTEFVDFLKFCIDFVVERENYSILKYIPTFAGDLPKSDREDVNSYAGRLLTAEHMITL